jgi:subtilisin family serine protease
MLSSNSISITRATRTRMSLLLALFIVAPVAGCRDAFVPTGPSAPKIETPTSQQPRRDVSHARNRNIPDEYIVVFDSSVQDVRGRANALARISGALTRFTFEHAIHGFAAHMSSQAAEALAQHPGVAYVEPDQLVQSSAISSFTPSWGIDRIDQTLLPLDERYSYNATGAGVTAYIIDTGIRTTHTQFGGRAVGGFTSISDGWGSNDCSGHGTHVAATVGGSLVGVAKAVTLYSVRVLDCSGSGTMSGVIAGVDWVTANFHRPAVANMSLGGYYSDALNIAVQNSINAGVTYVVAAGNSATDACESSPASLNDAITVGAAAPGDAQASYSNYGPCVDIFAPGSSIVSAWNSSDDVLVKASGTSMASPHVAGAAALYLESNPGASPAEVGAAILASATTNALSLVPANTVNKLLRVNGPAEGAVLPPASAPPATINVAPNASFSISCPSQKNYCSFDASTSTDDGRIVSYSWNFGDQSSAVTAANPITAHNYVSKGSFTITLTVADESGLTASTQRSIQIKSVNRR